MTLIAGYLNGTEDKSVVYEDGMQEQDSRPKREIKASAPKDPKAVDGSKNRGSRNSASDVLATTSLLGYYCGCAEAP